MYEAKRWNNDPRFQAPMTTLKNGDRVFIGDFVCAESCYGTLKKIEREVAIVSVVVETKYWVVSLYHYVYRKQLRS